MNVDTKLSRACRARTAPRVYDATASSFVFLMFFLMFDVGFRLCPGGFFSVVFFSAAVEAVLRLSVGFTRGAC